ncbi:MAG: class 1 fructose-bisphosphatase [Chloroflexi bacterium]|nr:MAG: class 1 fructose-bisphosphatase [Chloroflexota bacterium]
MAVNDDSAVVAKDPYAGKIVTIERFILDQQRIYPDATGTLTNILYDIALAAKIIASKTTRAGLTDILGSADKENVQGEVVQKLDEYADQILFKLNDHTGRLAVMASEERAEIIPIPDHFPVGPYVLLYDPLDGSSNIDVNVSVGTIFAIYRRKTASGRGTLEDCLQKGRDLVAAGYVIYGSSTMLVYSTGQGVHGFTLDPTIGEFFLSHPNIRIPEKPKFYSVNQGYEQFWSEGVQRYTEWLQGKDKTAKPLSMRYIGSLVADFHRNLLSGGVYYYPADTKDPGQTSGKLRLVYECAPMAFLAEQAGGKASTGTERILEMQPSALHQRVPFFVGNSLLVEKAQEFIRDFD